MKIKNEKLFEIENKFFFKHRRVVVFINQSFNNKSIKLL